MPLASWALLTRLNLKDLVEGMSFSPGIPKQLATGGRTMCFKDSRIQEFWCFGVLIVSEVGWVFSRRPSLAGNQYSCLAFQLGSCGVHRVHVDSQDGVEL